MQADLASSAFSIYILIILLAFCGFFIQFGDSACSYSYATACFTIRILLFVSGFHKMLWMPQILSQIRQFFLFLELFEPYSVLTIRSWVPQQFFFICCRNH